MARHDIPNRDTLEPKIALAKVIELGFRKAAQELGCSHGKLYDIASKNGELYQELRIKLGREIKPPAPKPDIVASEQDLGFLRRETLDTIETAKKPKVKKPAGSKRTDKKTSKNGKQEANQPELELGPLTFDTRPLEEREPTAKPTNKAEPPAIVKMAVAKIASAHIEALRYENRIFGTDRSTVATPLTPAHNVFITPATQRSQLGMQLAHPWRGKPRRSLQIKHIVTGFKHEWTVVGWLDGRDCGNGCLNITICRPEQYERFRFLWETAEGLTTKEFTFKKLGPEFYKKTPAEGRPDLQYGEMILDAKTQKLLGYHLIPMSAISQEYYHMVEHGFH